MNIERCLLPQCSYRKNIITYRNEKHLKQNPFNMRVMQAQAAAAAAAAKNWRSARRDRRQSTTRQTKTMSTSSHTQSPAAAKLARGKVMNK